MEISPIYKRVIGLDVHHGKISACAVVEQADGSLHTEQREFGAFKRDRRALADAQWLATLARAGLLRASLIPPADIRYLHLIARQRQKLGGMLVFEKNRLHKLLIDAGIRLNVVVF